MTPITAPTRIIREDDCWNLFIVAGPRGAVACRTMPGGLPVDIWYHSPRPDFPGDEPSPDCDVLGGACYDSAGANVAGLVAAWLAEGSDDEVIWRALEARYEAWEGEGR
jgi:hypothetical protein